MKEALIELKNKYVRARKFYAEESSLGVVIVDGVISDLDYLIENNSLVQQSKPDEKPRRIIRWEILDENWEDSMIVETSNGDFYILRRIAGTKRREWYKLPELPEDSK